MEGESRRGQTWDFGNNTAKGGGLKKKNGDERWPSRSTIRYTNCVCVWMFGSLFITLEKIVLGDHFVRADKLHVSCVSCGSAWESPRYLPKIEARNLGFSDGFHSNRDAIYSSTSMLHSKASQNAEMSCERSLEGGRWFQWRKPWEGHKTQYIQMFEKNQS